MLVIPAIDLMGGKCVRLVEGKRESREVYRDDPLAVVSEFAAAGAKRIHVVDLDGAFEGSRAQGALIAEICKKSPVPIQTGGGIRDRDAIERAIEAGARYVVLGTLAATDPTLLEAACEAHPDSIVVAVDARDGKVSVEGWTRESALTALELALTAQSFGAAAVLYTDIARDGKGAGPNVTATATLQSSLAIPVIASGGIGSLADLAALRAAGAQACVIGRALYRGAFTLAEAL